MDWHVGGPGSAGLAYTAVERHLEITFENDYRCYCWASPQWHLVRAVASKAWCSQMHVLGMSTFETRPRVPRSWLGATGPCSSKPGGKIVIDPRPIAEVSSTTAYNSVTLVKMVSFCVRPGWAKDVALSPLRYLHILRKTCRRPILRNSVFAVLTRNHEIISYPATW